VNASEAHSETATAAMDEDEAYDFDERRRVLLESDATDALIAGKPGRETEVFVKGIAAEASESDVHAALRKCGAESGATGFELVTDRTTGTHRGYAFARYDSRESAANAVAAIAKAECEVKKMKITASVKPSKYRVMVTGLRKDATREEIVEALRSRGAGLEFFALSRPRSAKKNAENAVVESGDHNGGRGWASFYNEACAERFMKNMAANREEKLPVADDKDKRGLVCEFVGPRPQKKEIEIKTLHVTEMNEANATDQGLREAFERYGTILGTQIMEKDRTRGWVFYDSAESVEKALAECEPVEGAAEGDKGGAFISSVDGSTIKVMSSRKSYRSDAGNRGREPNSGRGGPSRGGGRDDWSKYRSGDSKYGGGLAPRGSWSGARQVNATPVILPTGQVAYAIGGGGGRGRDNRRNGRGRDNRHRPY
jgi:RNA recognition motif-containing protein